MKDQIKYKDYSKMITERAWACLRKYPDFEIDDLVAQGNLIFCEALKDWDPERAEFASWLYQKLVWGFMRYGRKTFVVDKVKPFTGEKILDVEELTGVDVAKNYELKNLINSLTKEAKEVISILFNSPSEVMQLGKTKKLHPRKIKNGLIKIMESKGFEKDQVQKAFTEIRKGIYS